MSSKVTMQDIADALNLSRNTVSKAINNTGVIAESTKKLILQKAVEMGYRNHSGVGRTYGPGHVKQDSGVDVSKKEIAMLTSSMPGGSHFAVTTLDRMQQIFSSNGYSLTYYRITKEELESLNLPGTLNLNATAAMFCMELFHYDYCRMLADTGVPLLLIDGPALFDKEPLPADMLIMENCASIHYFVRMLAQKGKRSVGFIGNILHCQSFQNVGAVDLELQRTIQMKDRRVIIRIHYFADSSADMIIRVKSRVCDRPGTVCCKGGKVLHYQGIRDISIFAVFCRNALHQDILTILYTNRNSVPLHGDLRSAAVLSGFRPPLKYTEIDYGCHKNQHTEFRQSVSCNQICSCIPEDYVEHVILIKFQSL